MILWAEIPEHGGVDSCLKLLRISLLRGRLGQTWLDSSAFFEAQSNAGKTPRAAVWRVGGGGEQGLENLNSGTLQAWKGQPLEQTAGSYWASGVGCGRNRLFIYRQPQGQGGLLRADFQKVKIIFFINSSLRESSRIQALHGSSLAPIWHPPTPGCIPCDN